MLMIRAHVETLMALAIVMCSTACCCLYYEISRLMPAQTSAPPCPLLYPFSGTGRRLQLFSVTVTAKLGTTHLLKSGTFAQGRCKRSNLRAMVPGSLETYGASKLKSP